MGRLSRAALAGPFGAGKTALVLDSLIPAARAMLTASALPGHVRAGTPAEVARDPGSVTGPWLSKHLSLPKARR